MSAVVCSPLGRPSSFYYAAERHFIGQVGQIWCAAIIRLLQENPSLSVRVLAEKIGISARVTERHISKLKSEEILTRKGATKNGQWVVVEQDKYEKQ